MSRADESPLPFTRTQRQKAGIADPKMKRWRDDCRVFAHEVLGVHGDKWQELFWAAVSGPHIDPAALRMLALLACKGPGKTFALAVVALWWLFTRWHANGIALSITSGNLRDNLWAEIARLMGNCDFIKAFFTHLGERLESKEFSKTWWLSARSFPQNADKSAQANTLAGLHGRHPIVLCDEAGDYPDGVVVAAEAILSSLVDGKPPDGRIIIAGNPTSTEGPLYRVVTKDRHRWWVYKISSAPNDPNRTPRVDPEWAQAQIDTWGWDSDFVKTNIRGEFPSTQGNKLIGPDILMEASGREVPEEFQQEALIFGLDVARLGHDASVLFQRQGVMTWQPMMWRETDLMTLADSVATEAMTKKPAAIFIDQTGVGGGVIDRLRKMGVPVMPIDFGGAALDNRFFDRRSEMYWKMSEWLKMGGTIPDSPQLRSEIIAPNFEYMATGRITKFKLESKKELKKRGINSPDMADALALTFSAPVMSPTRIERVKTVEGKVTYEAMPDPDWGHRQTKIRGGTEDDWNPYGKDN